MGKQGLKGEQPSESEKADEELPSGSLTETKPPAVLKLAAAEGSQRPESDDERCRAVW